MDWKWPVLGTEALAAAVLGGMCWHKFFLEVPNSPTTESIDSRLDHLGQTANKEGKQAIRKQSLIKDLLGMALSTKARPCFLHSQSLPSGSLHNPLSTAIKGQTEEVRIAIPRPPK